MNNTRVPLHRRFRRKRQSVHEALCDNVDTRSALDHLRQLVAAANTYLSCTSPKGQLLKDIAEYVTWIFKVSFTYDSSRHVCAS